jgi:DNA-binding transcriptional LysR family regulator
VQSGELVRVLPNWKAPHGIFHAVYPSRRGLLPAVRVFIDYLVEQLSKH